MPSPFWYMFYLIDNRGEILYSYDKIGNMTSEVSGGNIKTYTYDANGNNLSFNLDVKTIWGRTFFGIILLTTKGQPERATGISSGQKGTYIFCQLF